MRNYSCFYLLGLLASLCTHVWCSLAHVSLDPTHSGYLPINKTAGSKLYYAYYETKAPASNSLDATPILLWLQGGPGCASTFGAFYELGPFSVGPHLSLKPNKGAWTKHYGLLLIDQPIGTGYSVAGNDTIPIGEIEMAVHLYSALQTFFTAHPKLQTRPFFITGESYAGKYVPSIAHFILQLQQRHAPSSPHLQHSRDLPSELRAPVFQLRGIAIGNGLTDPRSQTLTIADTAYHLGLISPASRELLSKKQEEVVGLIDSEQWQEAHEQRSNLLSMVQNLTGIATMLDVRRTSDYDATAAVDRFLNQSWVKEVMRAERGVHYESCSEAVDAAMGTDVMRTVKHLLPDVLSHMPVLLYQGQFDLQDGPASSQAWMASIEWEGQQAFNAAGGSLWESEGQVAGWWREVGNLRHVVVRNAGHMVPQDQPTAALEMIRDWVAHALALTNERQRGQPKTSTGVGTLGGRLRSLDPSLPLVS